jgi:hypothetical protein
MESHAGWPLKLHLDFCWWRTEKLAETHRFSICLSSWKKGHSIDSGEWLQVEFGFLLLKRKAQREVDGKKHRFPIANHRSALWWYPAVNLYPDKDKSL